MAFKFALPASWQEVLQAELAKPYMQQLEAFLQAEYAQQNKGQQVFPPPELIFKALELTPWPEVQVVILGQDPYHGSGQAMGLSFSVPQGVKQPPSLRNILQEVNANLALEPNLQGDLTTWAKQGVLLLNRVLTVAEGKAASHQKLGWEEFTAFIIQQLSQKQQGLVFMLWGKPAQAVQKFIDTKKHLVLTAPHPSPLAAYRGFFGCQHFLKANQFLEEQQKTPINWRL